MEGSMIPPRLNSVVLYREEAWCGCVWKEPWGGCAVAEVVLLHVALE